MSNRREFFAAATSGVALASIGAPVLAAAPADTLARRLGGSPSQAAFEALQGQTFSVVAGNGQRASLRLAAVEARPSAQPVEQFTLRFEGGEAAHLASGLHRLNHAQTGRFSLRLEPSGSTEVGVYHADCALLA
jgi:hypothetical protein